MTTRWHSKQLWLGGFWPSTWTPFLKLLFPNLLANRNSLVELLGGQGPWWGKMGPIRRRGDRQLCLVRVDRRGAVRLVDRPHAIGTGERWAWKQPSSQTARWWFWSTATWQDLPVRHVRESHSAYGCTNKVSLGSLEEVLAIAKCMSIPLLGKEVTKFKADDGSFVSIAPHHSWITLLEEGVLKLNCWTLDLKGAYKPLVFQILPYGAWPLQSGILEKLDLQFLLNQPSHLDRQPRCSISIGHQRCWIKLGATLADWIGQSSLMTSLWPNYPQQQVVLWLVLQGWWTS